MIIALYGDDSTDKRRDDSAEQRLLCAGAFIGWPATFFYVAVEWEKRLKRDGLAYFRASECESLNGEFDPRKRSMTLNSARALADSVRRDLSDIIANAGGLGGICVALMLDDYRDLVGSDPRAAEYFGRDPAIYTYACLIKKSIDLLDNDWPESKGVPIAFGFDSHTKWREAEEAYRSLSTVPRWGHRMGHIGHGDDKKICELQMADLMAHEGRHRARAYLAQSDRDRSSFSVLAGAHYVYYCGLIDKEAMLGEMDEALSQEGQ